MTSSIHTFIQSNGLVSILRTMVEYAEMQAHLYQSFGDHDKFTYWVRVWASLLQASDNIDIELDMGESLRLWHDYMHSDSHDETNGCFD